MSAMGKGASIWLPLQSSFARASGVELLRDGNMEELLATSWGAVAAATVAKSAVNPYAGTLCLVVTKTGAGWGYTTQAPCNAGRWFRARGAAAGDGVVNPMLFSGLGTMFWTGTTSTNWQTFDVTFLADSATIGIGTNVGAGGNFTRWDMLSIQEVLQVTLDIGDYCRATSWLCSERGGAGERATMTLALVDRHTGVVTAATGSLGPVTGWSYSYPVDQANTQSGKIPRPTITTQFDQAGTTVDFGVLEDSRSTLYFEQSTLRFVYTVYGRGTIKSLPCTFPVGAVITLQGDVDDATQLATLIVSGCTTGNGTFQTYFQAEKAVTCGDGFTAASFPTQLAPRGVSLNGSQYLEATYPLGAGVWTAVVFLTSDIGGATPGSHLIIDTRLGGGTGYVYTLNADPRNILVSSGTVYADGEPGTAIPYTRPTSIVVAGITLDIPRSVLIGTNTPFLELWLGRFYAFALYPYILTPTQIRELHERAKWETNT